MKKFRWLLFVPAGIFEIFLAAFAGGLAAIHYVCSIVLDLAYRLPSMDWYFGGDYKRKHVPTGYPDFRKRV